jgi:hypothetical protein
MKPKKSRFLLASLMVLLASLIVGYQNFTSAPLIPPKITASFLTPENSIGVVTDSTDVFADLVIVSPKLDSSRTIARLPVDAGRIRFKIPSADLATPFWTQLDKDGLLLRAKRPDGSFYEGSSVLHHAQSGKWTSAYRRTQLQGFSLGLGGTGFLKKMPDFLTDDSLSFPYHTRAGTREVPFASKFTVNKILGGYSPKLFPSPLDFKSKDLVYKDATKGLRYRFDILKNNLDPYLAAGYSPSDITLTIENVPWDLAKPACADGSDPNGQFGNRAAPANFGEWAYLIKKLAVFLRDNVRDAEGFRYKIGTEYNTIESFCGTQAEYVHLYVAAANQLRAVFPNAEIMLSEFAGNPVTLNVDYSVVFRVLQNAEMPTSALARSIHYIPNLHVTSTTDLANQMAASYRLVYGGVSGFDPATLPHEVHQFGIAGEKPFANFADYGDMGPRNAAWHFMMTMKMRKQINLKWLAHWELYDKIRNVEFIVGGTSWLYQIYDNFLGTYSQELPILSPVSTALNEYFATAFYDENRLFVLVASFNPDIDKGRVNKNVQIAIPMAILPGLDTSLPASQFSIKQVDFTTLNAPARYIRNLLATEAISGVGLKPEFVSNPFLLGHASQMVNETDPSLRQEALDKIASYLNEPGRLPALQAQMSSLFKLNASDFDTLTQALDGSFILNADTMGPSHLRLYEIRQR